MKARFQHARDLEVLMDWGQFGDIGDEKYRNENESMDTKSDGDNLRSIYDRMRLYVTPFI